MVTTPLAVTDLTYGYSRRPGPPAVAGVSFGAGSGRVVFVLGPNGSGKSTLFRLLLGVLAPDTGCIVIDGHDTAGLSVRRRARLVAYVPQAEEVAFDFTARAVALMGRTPHLSTLGRRVRPADEAVAEAALDTLGIGHLADVGVRSLSGGERQLVLIARALAQQARILVLDEPTSALDFANQTRVLTELRRLAASGLTLLVSSHNPMHALSHADEVLLLKRGKLVAHAPPADLTEADLTDLYETPLRLLRADGAPDVRLCVPAALAEPPDATREPSR